MRDAGDEILKHGGRVLRRTWWVSAAAVIAAGVWMFWPSATRAPLASRAEQLAAHGTTPTPSEGVIPSAGPRALDESVFNARLWVPPPRPVEAVATKAVPPVPPAPPPPFTLQLVGIERATGAGDEAFALVYDPAAMKVARSGIGASIGRYVVNAIERAEVVFADTQHPGRPVHRLKLRTLNEPKTPLKVVRAPGEGRSP